jgi:zinc/manganese transport system permease protein
MSLIWTFLCETEDLLKGTFLTPFAEFAFMRRALIATLALSISAPPIGVFMLLRRMSLTGDAMAHAILPGVERLSVCG